MSRTVYLWFFLVVSAGVVGVGQGCQKDGPDWDARCRDAIENEQYDEIIRNCSYLGYAEMTPSELLAVGKMALEENDPDNAKAFLQSIDSGTEEYGSAQFGILLAELQKVVRLLNVALRIYLEYPSMILGALQEIQPQSGPGGGISPRQDEDVLGIEYMEDLRAKAIEVVENKYSIDLESFPLIIGSELEELLLTFIVRGNQGELGARIVWLVSDIFIAVSGYFSAHSMTVDIGGLINSIDNLLRTSWEAGGGGLLGLTRGLARVAAANPGFLGKNPGVWDEHMNEVKSTSILGLGGDTVRRIVEVLEAEAVSVADQCGEAVCLVDQDSSGSMSSGDRLRINGSLRGEIGDRFFGGAPLAQTLVDELNALNDTLGRIGITVSASPEGVTAHVDFTGDDFFAASQSVVRGLADVLPPLENLMDAVMNSTGSEAFFVTFDDINPLISAMRMPPVPNVVRFNSQRFLDMPLRDLIAYTCEADNAPQECGGDTVPVFPIEVELFDLPGQCAEEVTVCGIEPYPYYFREGDGAHFSGSEYAISADGVFPTAGDPEGAIPTNTLLYLALADPSLNGSLALDLTALYAACVPEGTEGFEPADNYSLNKVLNCLQVHYLPQIEEAEIVREVVDFLEPVMEIIF